MVSRPGTIGDPQPQQRWYPPGMAPGTWKRNVLVALVYLLGVLVGLGVVRDALV